MKIRVVSLVQGTLLVSLAVFWPLQHPLAMAEVAEEGPSIAESLDPKPVEEVGQDDYMSLASLRTLAAVHRFAKYANGFGVGNYGILLDDQGRVTLHGEVVSSVEQLQELVAVVNEDVEWPAPIFLDTELVEGISELGVLPLGFDIDEIESRVEQIRESTVSIGSLSPDEQIVLLDSVLRLGEIADRADQELLGRHIEDITAQDTARFDSEIEAVLAEIYSKAGGSLQLANGDYLDPYVSWVGKVGDDMRLLSVEISGTNIDKFSSSRGATHQSVQELFQ